MRLTCIISSLGSGGAERVLTTLANAWAASGADVTILTFDSGRARPFFALHDNVALGGLDLRSNTTHILHAIVANARRIAVLRRAIRQRAPDVVIGFMDATNVLTLIATRGLAVPVVVSDRIDTARYSSGAIWDRLRRVTYPLADRIVVQTQAAFDRLPERERRAAVVIANPVVVPAKGGASPASLMARPPTAEGPDGRPHRKVLAMGRLTNQKGFDLLLRAFAMVAPRHPDWSIEIYGEGPERERLEALRRTLELNGRVALPGVTADPFGRMASADLFVLSSRFEGFPNVLCEAMACGLPVVAFDCPHGPREIIRDGVDGVLVEAESADRLADALSRLIEDEGERQRMAVRAPDVVHRFGLEKALRDWETVFADLTGCRHSGSLNDA